MVLYHIPKYWSCEFPKLKNPTSKVPAAETSVSLPWMEWFGVIVTVPCIDKVGIKSINISTLYICIVFMMVWCGYLLQITFIWIRGWVLQNQYHAPLVFNWKVQTKIEATIKDRHLNNKRVSGRCLHTLNGGPRLKVHFFLVGYTLFHIF